MLWSLNDHHQIDIHIQSTKLQFSQLPTMVAHVGSGPVEFVVDKEALGMFSLSISVFPANSHSTNCSIFINHPIMNAT
jgi:hypothetical protein